MARRVFITVGEVSGDRHAAQLIRGLRQLDPTLIIEGHGGPEMAAAGAVIHRDTVSKAAMGWRGILRAGEVYRLLRWTRKHFDNYRPDLQIGVDSPSMNFHFAKAARARQIPALQYVAPQLWAWAPWRMSKVRRWIDQVACILPFEESYFRAHGVNATFVGHPLFDELPPGRNAAIDVYRNGRPPVIGLLPGSRTSEARQNFPPMVEIAGQLRKAFPGARFLVPTTAATQPIVSEILKAQTPGGPPADFEFAEDAFDDMVPRCDLCLTVSGTATLHVAGFGVPMIVVYRTHPITWHAGGRWLIRTRTFALVNLLGKESDAIDATTPGGHIVPEFVPWTGSVNPVAQMAIDLLHNPQKLQSQRDRLSHLIRSLDQPGASMNVARLAMKLMSNGKG